MENSEFPSPDAIDQALEHIIADIPPDLFSYLRYYFQNSLSSVLGKTVELNMKLVLDTSSVIPELMSLVKSGKSVLAELVKRDFLYVLAPLKLIEEVEENIPKISRRHKLNQASLNRVWNETFKPKIKISNVNNYMDTLFGIATVGKRDPEDVPFVALTFSLKADGIITQDKDIIDQPEVRTWKMGKVKKLITIFQKGTFSFFISARFIVPLLRALFQIGVSILKSILDVVRKIINIGTNLISGLIKTVSKLPDWIKILLGISAIIVILHNETRKTIEEMVSHTAETIANFLSQVYDLINQFLLQIEPFIEFGVSMITVLFLNIAQSIDQLQSLKPYQFQS